MIRRDSPNGKRYARRGQGGSIEQAFGFDLTPLVARAAEFERLAGEVRAEARARHLLREEISLHRRDIAKTIATAFEEGLPGPWSDLADRFRQLGGMPPRSAEPNFWRPSRAICGLCGSMWISAWQNRRKQKIRAPMSLKLRLTIKIQTQTHF